MSRISELSEKQRKLLALLRQKERDGKPVTIAAVAEATGWTKGTVATYIGKGHLDGILTKVAAGSFEVRGAQHLTDDELNRALSQRQNVNELGFFAKHQLTKALLRRSRDNMVLCLEVFNRPSMENRLDAFAMLFTVAWEQLLKARIVEKSGEAAIFKVPKPGRARETIGIHDAIALLYQSGDPVRTNLERIVGLRNDATHLLMPELQGILSRIFQAGVLNYAEAFLAFAKVPFVPRHAVGLLTLVGDQQPPTVVKLRAAYGKTTGDEVQAIFEQLDREVTERDDVRYAIPVRLRLGFSEVAKAGDIVLTKGLDVGENAIVVEKAVDIDKSHPHLEKDAVKEIDAALRSRFEPDEFVTRIGSKGFTTFDFRAVSSKEGWKTSEHSSLHLHLTKPDVHRYSDEAVHFVVQSVAADAQYLERIRASYRAKLRANRKPA